ncbi:5140_t:CDS:2, partial [Diversispora eburnea]
MSIFENQIIYNNDNTVSVPFGQQIIKLCHVEGTVDFLEWECIDKKKSTNRIDDIIELTTKGKKYIKKIQVGIKKDKLCWSWIMYCAGDGNTCQHICSGIDFEQFCIGIDGKYNLNIDRAPILTMIVKNNIGYGTPLVFGLSNKENNWSIRLAVNAVKQNIPYCNNQIWNPYIMIDKHRPSKLGVEGLNGIFRNHLARCRTEETSFEMASIYKNFINSLPLTQEQKHLIINDLDNNWMCNEWRLQFIDAGRLPDAPNSNPMTTNNYTERMNRTIESKLSGKQT